MACHAQHGECTCACTSSTPTTRACKNTPKNSQKTLATCLMQPLSLPTKELWQRQAHGQQHACFHNIFGCIQDIKPLALSACHSPVWRKWPPGIQTWANAEKGAVNTFPPSCQWFSDTPEQHCLGALLARSLTLTIEGIEAEFERA
jgi:hypothetical protein